jgi:hypothetical protein
MWLCSQPHLKHHERFFIPTYHFYRTECFPGRKGRTATAIRKGIPHNHADITLLVSIKANGACIPNGSSEVLLAAVYKSPGHAWNDVDIIVLLSFRHKLLLEDPDPKHPFRNSIVSNPSSVKLLNLLHINQFKISAPKCVQLIMLLQEKVMYSILL